MAASVRQRLDDVHPRMLRAAGDADPQQMGNGEKQAGKRVIGAAIDKSLERSGITQKEAAFAMGYSDSGVIGRWINGTETPQFAKLWSLGHRFQQELVTALAEQVPGAEVETTVKFKRTA